MGSYTMPNISIITALVGNATKKVTVIAKKAIGFVTSPTASSVKNVSELPASSIKASYMPVESLKDKLVRKLTFVTKSGETKEAIIKFVKQGANERVSVSLGDNVVATGEITPHYLSQLADTGSFYCEKIKEFGDCVYIKMMRSYEQGGGTLFHKAIAERSRELGLKGKVALDAAWTSHPFHLKSGFVPLVDDAHSKFVIKTIEQDLAEAGGKRIDSTWIGGWNMILTPENAKKLLTKPVNLGS